MRLPRERNARHILRVTRPRLSAVAASAALPTFGVREDTLSDEEEFLTLTRSWYEDSQPLDTLLDEDSQPMVTLLDEDSQPIDEAAAPCVVDVDDVIVID